MKSDRISGITWQCKEDRTETKDYRQQWGGSGYSCSGKGCRRCSCTGLFYTGRKADWARPFLLRNSSEESKGQILESFIKQFYAGTPFIPAELMIQEELEEREILEEWLSKKREHRVHIRVPKKEKRKSWWSLRERMLR